MVPKAYRAAFELAPSLLLMPVIFWVQARAGVELSLFPLYLLPVADFSWRFGWRGALISSAVATGLWTWASAISGHHVYSHEWFRYFNGGVRGLVFVFFGGLIVAFRHTIETHRGRMEAMRALLNVCHGCGSVQGSSGQWIPLGSLDRMAHPLRVPECPACARRMQEEGVR